MSFKERLILQQVNEYMKKPEIKRMLVDKVIEAGKDPKFKEFLKEDIAEISKGIPPRKGEMIHPEPKQAIAAKKTVLDQDSIKKATQDILKELRKETRLKKEHAPLVAKLVEPLLQSRILDFRLKDLYLKQRYFAWTSSVMIICFLFGFFTRINAFIIVGGTLAVLGLLTLVFSMRTYSRVFGR